MLALENIHFSRFGREILSALSWQLKPAVINAIVGRNGAGKSTLLALLSGQESANSGSLTIDGQPLHKLSIAQRSRQIAMVSQRPEHIGHLSVRECLALGCLPWAGSANLRDKQVAEEVHYWLEKLDLQSFAQQPIARLSGGEQQRVLLAQALAQRTEILLLDEPTNHLDITQQYQLLSYLKQCGKTVVLTLHDINLARRFADQLLLLDKGRSLASGETASILNGEILAELYQMPFVELNSEHLCSPQFVPQS